MKKLLMVIPFDRFYPPMNGGSLRCFNLLNQLCKYFEVTALMHQDIESFSKSGAEFPDIKNANLLSTKDNKEKKDIYSLLPLKYRDAIRFRIWNRSLTEPAESSYLLLYPQMKEFLQSYPVDYVILEDMSIISLAKLVKRYHPGVPVIYDAYNVNSKLSAVALEKSMISQREYDGILKTETSLYNWVTKIFTCSENDLEELRSMNGGRIDGAVIPNGVGIPDTLKEEPVESGLGSNEILFCGSLDYLPNQEGLSWFCRHVFPLVLNRLPAAQLLVVGKGNPGEDLAELLKGRGIVNYGMVDRVDTYYKKAALAVVPLLSGSGTRLKLLESMAHRVPVVSTTSGAEGINYADGKNILIADGAELFAQRVVEMLDNPPMARQISQEAFRFVQNEYDWNIVGKKMFDYISGLN